MRSNPDLFRPVVALDIDGVLRIPEPSPGGVDAIAGEVTMNRGAYPRLFHSQPRWDPDGTHTGTHFFSGEGVRWVRSLIARDIDVRWCTTWQQYANVYFAPLLGLPELPVIAGAVVRRGDTSVDWKVRSIGVHAHGRPVLWADDHPWEDGLRQTHTPRALTGVRRINPSTGITAHDVEAMELWLTDATTTEGHVTLQREWRRERDRRRRRRSSEQLPPHHRALIL